MSVRLFLAPDFQSNMSSRGAAVISFDEAWDRWRGEVVDENRMRDVERIEFGRTTGFLKRFRGIQTKNHFRLRWQRPRCHSQAGREVAIMHALQNEGFRPPRVLAWGQELRGSREQRSLLLTEAFDGRALSRCSHATTLAQLPRVADLLGRAVRSGIFLPDLGLDHVFLLEDDSLGLIDFHNARRHPRPTSRELGRALVRFFTSPGADRILGERDEFASMYLEAAERPRAWRATQRLFRQRLPDVAATADEE